MRPHVNYATFTRVEHTPFNGLFYAVFFFAHDTGCDEACYQSKSFRIFGLNLKLNLIGSKPNLKL